MRDIVASNKEAEAAAAIRAKELAAIVVKPEDIKLLTTELELSEELADQLLREHKNDVAAAILAVVNKK